MYHVTYHTIKNARKLAVRYYNSYFCLLTMECKKTCTDQGHNVRKITSYYLICQIFWSKRLPFLTLCACRHIDHNSIKKLSRYKHGHSLSINRVLYHVMDVIVHDHIKHLGTCHCQPMRSQNLSCDELLSVQLEPSYPSPKFVG